MKSEGASLMPGKKGAIGKPSDEYKSPIQKRRRTSPAFFVYRWTASVCFGLKIDGGIFAATVDLDLKIETVAFL